MHVRKQPIGTKFKYIYTYVCVSRYICTYTYIHICMYVYIYRYSV